MKLDLNALAIWYCTNFTMLHCLLDRIYSRLV